MEEKIEQSIAKQVAKKGGKTYYVGGYVRDLILGKKSKDVDIEVHGISEKKLVNILSKLGEPLYYGKSFGIYSLKGYNIDIALPRKEIKTGKGHRDFVVEIDPFMDLKTAIKRRDFTINAIYKDVLTGEIIDPFNGIEDIKNKVIRHIDKKTFVEDPLRVLRACQFASRFNFKIDEDTIELCKKMDITNLPYARVEEETKKALLQSNKPSIYFKYIRQMNQYDYWFGYLHTKYIDKAKKYEDKVNDKYLFLLSALSINSTTGIVENIRNPKYTMYILEQVLYASHKFESDDDIFRAFHQAADINDFIYIRMLINEDDGCLFKKAKVYNKRMNKPYVTGDDIIAMGYKPGKIVRKGLDYATVLKLRGVSKKQALKKIETYLKKIST